MAGIDTLNITILEDGTIKVETDKVSPANHMNAEQFLKFCAERAGGKTDRQRRGHTHGEHHHHDHDHEEHKH